MFPSMSFILDVFENKNRHEMCY